MWLQQPHVRKASPGPHVPTSAHGFPLFTILFRLRVRTNHSCLTLWTLCFFQCLAYSRCSRKNCLRKESWAALTPLDRGESDKDGAAPRRPALGCAPHRPLPPSLHSGVRPEVFLPLIGRKEPPWCCRLYIVLEEHCLAYFLICSLRPLRLGDLLNYIIPHVAHLIRISTLLHSFTSTLCVPMQGIFFLMLIPAFG